MIESCDSEKAVIIGSTDFSYYHELEIIFHDVFFISGYFNTWNSDTDYPVFMTPNQIESYRMNFELEVTRGSGDIFVFNIEDSKNKVIVVAKSVSYNTDTVLYYYREDLLPGMRLAPTITKPTQS